jgi:hypothetical protein
MKFWIWTNFKYNGFWILSDFEFVYFSELSRFQIWQDFEFEQIFKFKYILNLKQKKNKQCLAELGRPSLECLKASASACNIHIMGRTGAPGCGSIAPRSCSSHMGQPSDFFLYYLFWHFSFSLLFFCFYFMFFKRLTLKITI